MKIMHRLFIWILLLKLARDSLAEVFKLILTMPNIDKSMSNQSVFVAKKLAIDEEIYIVDFQPIYNRRKVHFITTYLCSKPYSETETFWFDNQPCYNMDRSMIIYEWYYNVPAVQWPKDAGFRIGTNTPYQYVVIHIQYFPSIINEMYGQQIIISGERPKHKIGTYQIITNSGDFSCRYHSSLISLFSTRFYSNYEGRSISLYRVRNNQLQSIIKGNLQWPQTFYQLENSIDIQANDYFIGSCIPDDESILQTEDMICQITIMFWVEQEDEMPGERCWNNDHLETVELFLPIDADVPPETLFDINPTYPKLSPNEWAKMTEDISSPTSISIKNNTNILYLTYANDDHSPELIHLAQTHKLLLIFFIWGLAVLVGFCILSIVIILSRKKKKYFSKNNHRTNWISIGGERSSLSGWLTKRRFQQYDEDNNNNSENELLTETHRWAVVDAESDITDDEVFHPAESQNVVP